MSRYGWLAIALCVMGCSNGNKGADMGPGDAGVSDLAMPDLMPEPIIINGTNLVPVKGLTVIALTTDDQIAYTDGAALKTVPIAGGTPATVDSAVGLDGNMIPAVRVRGKAVFSWSQTDNTTAGGIGVLTVWTPTTGAQVVAQTALISHVQALPDGSRIIYTDNVNAAGTLVDIYVAKSDGTGKMLVVSGKSTDPSCPPIVATSAGKFLVSYCEDAGDAGVSGATIAQVDPTTGAATTLLSNVTDFYSVDTAGDKVFAIDMNGMAMVKTIGVTGATVIDSNASDGFITNDGTAVVYATTSGLLKRSAVDVPAPLTLVSSGNVAAIDGVSSDQNYLVFSAMFDQQSGLYDMYLAKTGSAGNGVTLLDTPTGSLYGDPFTSDDKYVVFYTDVDTTDFAGTLNAMLVKNVGMPVQLATRVWLSYHAGGDKFVFNDAYVSTMTGGTATLKSIDLSNTNPAAVITSKADQDFFVSSDNTKVVFTHNAVKGKEGLYAAPIP
jgi:hypothetical protein